MSGAAELSPARAELATPRKSTATRSASSPARASTSLSTAPQLMSSNSRACSSICSEDSEPELRSTRVAAEATSRTDDSRCLIIRCRTVRVSGVVGTLYNAWYLGIWKVTAL